ncbi:hypothetical protein EV146_11173 [Mesobacillus foraminis]|uniref:Uncharacterized protein n=1 Tax=Mesobacillus foraminis TaxID=279826 RepID=A0A4R2B6P1_9BACI|nr:hypothetical protein EV146_11173 [Mesobacillus foraminis]
MVRPKTNGIAKRKIGTRGEGDKNQFSTRNEKQIFNQTVKEGQTTGPTKK